MAKLVWILIRVYSGIKLPFIETNMICFLFLNNSVAPSLETWFESAKITRIFYSFSAIVNSF